MAKLVLTKNRTPVKEFPLDQERVTIGRAKDNDIQLDDRAVSGHHAVIVTLAGQSHLQDLNSTNGTYVNGGQVKKHPLDSGDIIQIGTNELEYEGDRGKGANQSDEFEKTMVLTPSKRPTQGVPSVNDVHEAVHEASGGQAAPDDRQSEAELPRARLQVLSGRNFGEEIDLNKSVTTVGRPGVQVAAVTRRSEGYTIVHVRAPGDAGDPPKINGRSIGNKAVKLEDNDVIEVAGVKMGFFLDA